MKYSEKEYLLETFSKITCFFSSATDTILTLLFNLIKPFSLPSSSSFATARRLYKYH